MTKLTNKLNNEENFDISIIIVSWTAKDFLMECLQSVCETTQNVNCEVYVVDNDSPDGSSEAVARYFPKVNLIRNKRNLGYAVACNIGMKQCSGHYILPINSDIIVLPRCIEKLVALMDQHPRIGMAGPRTLNPDGTLQPTCMRLPTMFNTLFRTLALDKLFPNLAFYSAQYANMSEKGGPLKVEALYGSFLIVRREALEEVGLYDEDFFFYGEDKDWCKRFHKAGWDIVYYPSAQIIHFGGASSSNRPVWSHIEFYEAQLLYWKKHHGNFGKFYCAILILFHQVLRIIPRVLLYAVCKSKRKIIFPKIERSFACIQWLLHI